MAGPSQHAIAEVVLARYGRTFAEELGIPVAGNSPSALFRLLTAALLFSARIRASAAMQAARALSDHGWTTAQKMANATWAERTRVLNRSGYARYDESTSRMLGDTAGLLLERYGGDLRRLRQQAERDPARERQALQQFKGIGDVGVDIFFREVQIAWDELFPFADPRALEAAGELKLSQDAKGLLDLVGPDAFPRLVAALVRVDLADDYASILEQAQGAQ